ncbi:MAG: UbiD family decarboxylase [Phycisphaeraceae bacterium]
MAYASLQQFVEALEQAGELHRVTEPVSCMLEVAAIADRVSKTPAARLSDHAAQTDPLHHGLGGKAVLFENVTLPDGSRSEMPLLINAFGSYRRIEMALGCEEFGLEGLAQRVADLVKPEPPNTLMEKLKKGLELAKIAQLPPKIVSKGACQEVVKTGDEIDLTKLPIIKCWPDDGDPRTCGYPLSPEQSGTAAGLGRYITLAGMYTIHPDDAGKPEGEPRPSRNIGMYRAQLIDATHTAMHWHVHHDGASHWRAWKKHNEAKGDHSTGMPCAIVLGGESVLPYSATAPLPPGISELLFAGFLNKGSIKLVKCKSIDMHVPANAELVIEGYVSTQADGIGYNPNDKDAKPLDPENEVFEGPFGDHTGFYSLPDRYPIFTATAVTMREKPVYATTVVGPPPQEDYYLGKATERIFLPLLKTLVPDIIDYDLPMFGAFHNCAFIKIKKEYPLQARRIMHAIWGAGQMAWTKFIVVVDEDVDVHNHEAVLFHLCANVDPGRDLEIVNGPLDILDHAAPRLGAGQKLGVDATRKWPGEEVNGNAVRDWPTYLGTHQNMPESVDAIVQNITSGVR